MNSASGSRLGRFCSKLTGDIPPIAECRRQVLPKPLLIIVGAILAATICGMDAAWQWILQGDGIVESLQCKIMLESIAHRPPNDLP